MSNKKNKCKHSCNEKPESHLGNECREKPGKKVVSGVLHKEFSFPDPTVYFIRRDLLTRISPRPHQTRS